MKEKLEAIYAQYPRKVGKSAGMERLRKSVKDEAALQDLQTALNKYKQFLVDSEITDPKFIKMWSTFCTTWQDWLDYESITGSAQSDPFRLIKGGV